MQWEETQRKTYTKWVNMYLARRKPPVKLNDIIEDFRAGPERICELLELLCGIKIDMQGGKLPGQATTRFHQISIVQNALEGIRGIEIIALNWFLILYLILLIFICFRT